MEFASKNGRYGYLIKWVIGVGDMLLLNLFFIILYRYFNYFILKDDRLDVNEIGEIFLLINLCYFITITVLPLELSSNIVFFDKIVQRSLSFISFYIIIFSVGLILVVDALTFSWLEWIVVYIALGAIYSLWHIFFRLILKLYRRQGYNFKRIIIIGGGLNGINVYHELVSSDYGYKILGFFDDDINKEHLPSPCLGTVSQVEHFSLKNKVDEIYCTLPGNQELKVIRLLNFAEKNMIRFYLVPEFYKYVKRRLVLSSLQTIPIIAIRKEPLQSLSNRIVKRSFDILFSGFILLTVFPIVYLIFGIIIKATSKGSIIFKQARTGLEGKVFYCYKFRSMALNNESDLKITCESDPRITRVGKFMRKTSIDEIPQFINVFWGNMSVVGPRPHMLQQTELYINLIDKFMIRHLIKPGVTGWAQISGYRGETKTIEQMEGRFKRDIWYLENWSFFLDIKIIFVTIINLLRRDTKAY